MEKIYGPYINNKSRSFIIRVSNNTKTTQSYPRYLLEQHLNRKLSPDEIVDHINNDFTDNRIENLQILTLKENSIKEMLRPERARKLYTFICPNCNKETTKWLNNVKSNHKKGKTGPFCSRKCAGQFTYKNPWIK
jgi:hypothetical protein